MSGFEEYVKGVTDGLDLSAQAIARIREEARSHLEDEKARLVACGVSEDEAARRAMEHFGRGDLIGPLVSQALAQSQRRFKRQRTLRFVGLLALSWAIGAAAVCLALVGPEISWLWRGLTALRGILKFWWGPLVLACTLCPLALIAGRLAGTRKRVSLFAAGGVFAACIFSVALLIDVGIFLGSWIEPGTNVVSQLLASSLSLYMTTGLVIVAASAIMRRDRTGWALSVAALSTGFVASTIIVVSAILARQASGVSFGLVAGISVSFGFTAVYGLFLVWLLARALALRDKLPSVGTREESVEPAK